MSDASSIPNFGPIFQAVLALIMGGVAIAVWLHGLSRREHNTPEAVGAQLYFDGPLKLAVDCLRGVYRTVNEMRGENRDTIQEFRQRHEAQLEILRDMREYLKQSSEYLRTISDELRRR